MNKIFKILLAEDDPNSAKVVMTTLERYNFFVTLAEDGRIALSKVQDQKFDLIISDIMMPHMDGLTFVQKAQEKLQGTPVIMLTAVGEKEKVMEAAQYKVNVYLLKPISPMMLFVKVKEVMGLHDSDVIDKKLLPFKIIALERAKGELLTTVYGCPNRKSAEEISTEVNKKLMNDRSLSIVRFEVREEFAYEYDAIEILNDAIGKIIRQSKIKPESIRLEGKFFEFVDLEMVRKSDYLSQCILQTK